MKEGTKSTFMCRLRDVSILEDDRTGFTTEFGDDWFKMLPSK